MMQPVIVWFRQDLRLADNLALDFAAKGGKPVICLFLLDETDDWQPGGAARWWLHHSLKSLDASLQELGGGLVLRRGDAVTVLKRVMQETDADQLVWNRCIEPFARASDRRLEETFSGRTETFHPNLLFEPWEIETKGGAPFRVFTPFWNALRDKTSPAKPRPAPEKLHFAKMPASEKLDSWQLTPIKPDWSKGFRWQPGEKTAQRALDEFLDCITNYKTGRDIPSVAHTSGLSAHLHWGEISPRQIWHMVKNDANGRSEGAQTFLKELGWREFCHQLLYYNPDMPEQPLDKRFEKFPWQDTERNFTAWSRGMTGIPIVDAGMRQLWQTGWMHNRVRMITASFLIKHLGIDWRRGEKWFWDTLVDADLANNAANWQWVAGCGADAAPFFRIFNPVLQGVKFDSEGVYVRRFVPELRDVPDKFIHHPWDAPQPPKHYPKPIVDLAEGRDRALKAFRALKP
jgi:deoxyribodipyrimidine photo-lyase